MYIHEHKYSVIIKTTKETDVKMTKEQHEENIKDCILDSLGYPDGIEIKVEYLGEPDDPSATNATTK